MDRRSCIFGGPFASISSNAALCLRWQVRRWPSEHDVRQSPHGRLLAVWRFRVDNAVSSQSAHRLSRALDARFLSSGGRPAALQQLIRQGLECQALGKHAQKFGDGVPQQWSTRWRGRDWGSHQTSSIRTGYRDGVNIRRSRRLIRVRCILRCFVGAQHPGLLLLKGFEQPVKRGGSVPDLAGSGLDGREFGVQLLEGLTEGSVGEGHVEMLPRSPWGCKVYRRVGLVLRPPAGRCSPCHFTPFLRGQLRRTRFATP